MKEYLNNHPEVKAASLEVQNKRYHHYEKRRQERISKTKERRNELIKAQGDNSSLELKKSQSCFNMTSFLLKKGIDKLEQMKRHHLYEIKTMIDYELQQNYLRKKSEDKLKQYQEKEELIRDQRKREQIEIKLRKRLEEKEREKKIEKDELLNILKVKQIEEEELEMKEEENKRRERLEKEAQKRQLEQLEHQEKLQKKLDQILIKRHNYHLQKKKENEIKEENRKKIFEEKRIENTKRSLMNQQIAQDKLYRTFMKNEEESMKKKASYEEKQMKKEQVIVKCGEEIERKSQEQSLRMRMKKQKIADLYSENEKIALKKIGIYQNRIELAEMNRREKEERTKDELIKKIMQKRLKERDNNERKYHNDASLELKHSLQLERSYQVEEKVKIKREQLYQENVNKFIAYGLKYEENNEAIDQNDKQLEFKNQLRIESFNNKERRVEEMLKKKNEIFNKTKSCEKEINNRKEEIISNVNRLLKTGKLFTREEMYHKVFTSDEYNSISSRNMNQLMSGSCCSPKMSNFEITPSNIANGENSKVKCNNGGDDGGDNKRSLNIRKFMLISSINETYKRPMQIKETRIDNINVIKDTNLFKTPNSENDLFVTQNKFNSLDSVLKK